MLLRFFKSSQPIMFLLLPLSVVILWWKLFSETIVFTTSDNAILVKYFYLFLGKSSKIFSVISSLLVLLLAFLLTKFNDKYRLTDKSSFLTAFFYIIIVSGIEFIQIQSHLIFAAIFLFIAFIQIFNAYKKEAALSELFNSAFFVAIGTMFYAKMLFFFPIIMISILITRTYNWREWISMIIGFVLPFILYFSIFFLLDNIELAIKSFKIDLFYVHPQVLLKLNDIIFISLLSVIGVFSIISIFIDYSSRKIGTRNILLTMFFLILGIVIVFFSFGTNAIELFYFLGIPMSIFLTDFFVKKRRKWIKEVLFSLLIGALLYSQIVG